MERYPALLRTLLQKRGIAARDEAERFLAPDYTRDLHDPFLLPGMECAVERILRAIRENEKMVIYGDYDCDGIPGSVVLHDFFRKVGYENFYVYIPHRFDEGYGFHAAAVRTFIASGTRLIVTVDVGITDGESVALAQSAGVDVIVTDHHEPAPVLPPAYAIVNPKVGGHSYPFVELSGAGVAFKLVQALIVRMRNYGPSTSLGASCPKSGWEKWLLDLVGISTVSDMVPLVGENRALAHFGLRVLRKTLRPGLLSLFRLARVSQENIAEDDIGFSLGPRLNAAGRMDKPIHAFDLLATEDSGRASDLARHLEKMNDDRKCLILRVMDEAETAISGKDVGSVIVVGSESWPPGILGLAAGRLVERFKRPVFVWGANGGESLKGSCRSDGSVNISELMQALPGGILTDCGGHEGAGGFSVAKENILPLERELCRAYEKSEKKEVEGGGIKHDAEMTADEVTWENYGYIEMCGPYGVGNRKPIFLFMDIVPEKVRRFGKSAEHFEMIIPKRGGAISAVKFFSPAREVHAPCSFLAHIEKNTFRRIPELRLRIVEFVS